MNHLVGSARGHDQRAWSGTLLKRCAYRFVHGVMPADVFSDDHASIVDEQPRGMNGAAGCIQRLQLHEFA